MKFMFDSFRTNDSSSINAETLQLILDETLSPKLERLNLVKSGSYLWQEKGDRQIRKGFSYSLLKGASGTFIWGVNLDFIPTISGNKVRYHRTPNSYLHHIFEWTDEYSKSFTGGNLQNGVTNHFGLMNAKKSIKKLFDRYEDEIRIWYEKANTIDDLLNVVTRQMEIGLHYKIHSPTPAYVLAFLYAKKRKVDKALRMLDHDQSLLRDSSVEIKETLRQRLIKLATSEDGT